MQHLIFEEAWERTISDGDRQRIKDIFEKTKTASNDGISFIIIQVASNHRNDLLVTSLVHNFSNEPADLTNASVQLVDEHNGEIGSMQVQDERLRIPADTSMPWTFIFPKLGDKEQSDINRPFLLSRR
ncbi:SLAP domain-containing protein [Gracilibacillus salinarum]|uniref:SLAP domain-containing protein n=1 Tax=Gracilibacillus salinarum TaxID=2932255 RepID=A0ABY4GME1_9BACI|nr:SLAP domain-containing protein [Gracilibacillus salinarum]UOQ84532.1 SLAP domain-containing protein [Gracilibacillus salinarum]